jgi:hypothetical protein
MRANLQKWDALAGLRLATLLYLTCMDTAIVALKNRIHPEGGFFRYRSGGI